MLVCLFNQIGKVGYSRLVCWSFNFFRKVGWLSRMVCWLVNLLR